MTLKILITLALLVLAGTGWYHSSKALPAGISYRGQTAPLVAPQLLTDTTLHYQDGSEVLEQEIFDEALRLIAQAKDFILVDMFLYNSSRPEGVPFRPLARQLTQALIARKQARPELQIIVISDPINTLYGGTTSPWFEQLKQADIQVLETHLPALRDSNPAWSAIWRLCCQWLGNNPEGGWLPNVIGDQPVTLRSYLALPNFKANHRKLLVVDKGQELRALVTSANPHDGSSRHSNIGLAFSGPAVTDLLVSERAVMVLSGADTGVIDRWITRSRDTLPGQPVAGEIQVLTESAIRNRALAMIDSANAGDQLDLAMFYLSHRKTVAALIRAAHRGTRLRVLLDANFDAFGHTKKGIPNRQVAMELQRAGIPVRWCNTRGEQCHSKLLILRREGNNSQILLGSANFTRRNLDDLNLETSVWVSLPEDAPETEKAVTFFDRYWQSGPDQDPVMSLPYADRADESRFRYWRYRIMEATGLSTF